MPSVSKQGQDHRLPSHQRTPCGPVGHHPMLGGVFIFAEASTIPLSALAGRDAQTQSLALRSPGQKVRQRKPFFLGFLCCVACMKLWNIFSSQKLFSLFFTYIKRVRHFPCRQNWCRSLQKQSAPSGNCVTSTPATTQSLPAGSR